MKSYYHNNFNNTLAFIVEKKRSVLFIGSYDGQMLSNLSPSRGVGVEVDKKVCQKAQKRYPKFKFICRKYEDFKPTGKFDYIILNGVLGKTNDIVSLLQNIRKTCKPTTRVIVYQHNHLWQWLINIAEKFNIKRKEGVHNWLSVSDVSQYLGGSGYEVTRTFRKTLSPLYLSGLGLFIDWIGIIFPFFDFLKLDQFLVARADPNLFPNSLPTSLTICITVRDEKENIEPIVKSIPEITEKQEILFVEGHSSDGTLEEIKRVIGKYPNKKVRVIGQPGKGQGDAIRVGYKEAKGDIIVLYEGDGTSDAGDVAYFYDAMSSGRFEFIEGSRFVYPLDSDAMPILNKIGNMMFAKWFSFFLGQRTTDVLSGIKASLKRDYDLLYDRWGYLGIDDPFGDFELLYGSARMGLKFGEMPMKYYPRKYGESKTNIFVHGRYLVKMALRGYLIFRKS